MKKISAAFWLVLGATLSAVAAPSFEGRLEIASTRGSETTSFLYSAGKNFLRIEVTGDQRPYAIDLVNLETGAVTLIFPHNQSFVRLKPAAMQPTGSPGLPTMPPMPPGIGPQTGGNNTALPSMPSMPAMPMMAMAEEKLELNETGEKKTILGFACTRYEIKQRGETMEIWATDKLVPFETYQQNQSSRRFGPRMLEEEWGELLKAKKLFPLLALLRFDVPALPDAANPPTPGPELMRFEVKAIDPKNIPDEDGKLFSPPADYHEVQPLPF